MSQEAKRQRLDLDYYWNNSGEMHKLCDCEKMALVEGWVKSEKTRDLILPVLKRVLDAAARPCQEFTIPHHNDDDDDDVSETSSLSASVCRAPAVLVPRQEAPEPSKRRKDLAPGEFFCKDCKRKYPPVPTSVEVKPMRPDDDGNLRGGDPERVDGTEK
eukprot:CAMPEP_0176118092 /NCGR_PEP_ID=MMETSP0120_2-20121206/59337_1 /TAXON_ID=160619 /ORGANISM="Kryptoperidinium foliaceum, Strain CCMP 1326" /LENGTH=158 /DNA_ID=CAMNT_0017452407 /DNA_START=360 /DNA_END=834 /DNA_ORIENTATION=-